MLDGVGAPRDFDQSFTAWETFVGYLVLDALAGNTDRHAQNWTVIVDPDGAISLAPSFDHASSLGFAEHDERRMYVLAAPHANDGLLAWTQRARSPFVGRPHPIDAAIEALATTGPEVRSHWAAAVEQLPDPAALLLAIPDTRITTVSLQFAAGVVSENRSRLLEMLKGSV